MRRSDMENPDNKIVAGVCSECKEHCEGELEEDGWTYSDCCGASIYNYEQGED